MFRGAPRGSRSLRVRRRGRNRARILLCSGSFPARTGSLRGFCLCRVAGSAVPSPSVTCFLITQRRTCGHPAACSGCGFRLFARIQRPVGSCARGVGARIVGPAPRLSWGRRRNQRQIYFTAEVAWMCHLSKKKKKRFFGCAESRWSEGNHLVTPPLCLAPSKSGSQQPVRVKIKESYLGMRLSASK